MGRKLKIDGTIYEAEVKYNGNHLMEGQVISGTLTRGVAGVYFIHYIEEDDYGNELRELDVEVKFETIKERNGNS